MSTERAERQPKTTLFPLSTASTLESVRVLRYIKRTEGGPGLNRHAHRVLQTVPLSPLFIRYVNGEFHALPPQSRIADEYVMGLTVACDSIATEIRAGGFIIDPVRSTDLEAYKRIKKRIISEGWLSSSEEGLEHVFNQLEKFVTKDDTALELLIIHMLDAELEEGTDASRYFKKRTTYLLGISDGYFLHRYASERERAMKRD